MNKLIITTLFIALLVTFGVLLHEKESEAISPLDDCICTKAKPVFQADKEANRDRILTYLSHCKCGKMECVVSPGGINCQK